ncbi:Smr/MutS family protein [Desulfopila aestuarii]|uniref:Smr domain-containing protein n=1 Tax=Desulfopila aestuarii DSM 18488 TaxID=1121416 RepID=A0A1M7YKR6_9BACT|nr:Smr/MutS family protein [Desulfopila aestuarii]SHO53172.1 Smr domain-containing protein [Desulfopila aestuarii DSM 18488]
MDEHEHDQYVEIPINGILDLHMFSPKDLKTLIPDYIEECRAKNITELRLIHGKGIGNIRRSVHAILERNPMVKSFYLAGNESGGWGATIVLLNIPDE